MGNERVAAGHERDAQLRARSLVPITSTPTRGWAAMARTSKIAVGVSIIAQIVTSTGAPAASSRAGTSSTSATESTLGITTADGPDGAAAAMSSAPHSVSRPLQRIVSSRLPYSPRLTAATAFARRLLGVGGDGVLEVEDDRVGGDGLGLLERPLVGRWHVQHRAARPQSTDRRRWS